jgi:hypothetical protein
MYVEVSYENILMIGASSEASSDHLFISKKISVTSNTCVLSLMPIASYSLIEKSTVLSIMFNQSSSLNASWSGSGNQPDNQSQYREEEN